MDENSQRRVLNAFVRFGFKAGDTLVTLGRLVPRALVAGMLSGWLVSHMTFPAHANGLLRELASHPYLWSVLLVFLVLALDAMVLYPKLRDPLRSLPVTWRSSAMLVESPRGKSSLAAMKDYPDASLIRLGGRYAVLCAGHDALRDVLSTHAADFEKPWPVRSFLARPLGWGVIVNEGALHHRQRRILNPAFHIGKIRMLYGLMWAKVLIFAQKLEEVISQEAPKSIGDEGWAEVEIAELASRLTLDIIGPAAMGRDFQSLTSNGSNISDAYQELLRPSFGRLIFGGLNFMLPQWIVKWLPLSSNRILTEISTFLKKTCGEILQDKKREIAEGKNSLPDYSILKRIIETGELTDDETEDQMLTFLAAGHETTAGALTWACWLCATNPEVQRKLRAEIHTRLEYVGGQPPEGIVSWDVLESMPYLNGFCEEVLRLYPTVPVTVREAQRATAVAGYRVPKGTLFVLVPHATNRNPRAWGPDADRVVPERWIDTDPNTGVSRPNKTGGTKSNFAGLTFLHGPRACIGQDFAKAEMRCAVAGLVGGSRSS
ncbi:cytochrome P450 monooxygenase [Apiospora saccharicola]|uniref:Cytochrome P450 monooxygenase n=1 Tax=Apiospora saccharicola TaxID=335842 RepID=A0ABR1TK93_9PEZI